MTARVTEADLGPSQRLAVEAIRRGIPVSEVAGDAAAHIIDHAEHVAIRLQTSLPGRSDPLAALAAQPHLLEPPTAGMRYTHPCPICGAPTGHQDRYPRSVCFACRDRAADSNGRTVVGYNVTFSGGFVAHFAEPADGTEEICDEVTRSGRCWIDGIPCTIGEARFGGIVVQA